jgi:RimJ/RimL family protein N-acetyltransferase
MQPNFNDFGQPIGFPLESWQGAAVPERIPLEGRYCRLEPLDIERHGPALHTAFSAALDGRSWTYLPYGPFPDYDSYRVWLESTCQRADPLFFAIIAQDGNAPLGIASYLRIMPAAGSIEVGHLHFGPALKRSPAATEAMYLMMEQAFQLGYRRYEWKCDALNAPSRAAAERLGFTFEGIFRQATVYKRRTRDTAWFAIIDRDWPALQAAFQAWLDPANFDSAGKQRQRLSELTARAPRCS